MAEDVIIKTLIHMHEFCPTSPYRPMERTVIDDLQYHEESTKTRAHRRSH